ncbi:MAG: hypothetical protein B6245_13815 [Desulfobacteraceae bacterium 4572_88]|nr:MAG: hypothetical protein B6245_13815 [Desulfobacteraceae bacterium 4572_88]
MLNYRSFSQIWKKVPSICHTAAIRASAVPNADGDIKASSSGRNDRSAFLRYKASGLADTLNEYANERKGISSIRQGEYSGVEKSSPPRKSADQKDWKAGGLWFPSAIIMANERSGVQGFCLVFWVSHKA